MATSYVLPQARVFQEFEATTTPNIQDLNAFICGGHAYLARLSDADEKATAYLGQYDHVGSLVDGEYKTCYSWPDKPTGSVIDTSYTLLGIDNALLRYYQDNSHTLVKTDRNKVRNPSVSFAANGSSYARSAAFYDRDVAVGDIVVISGIPTITEGGSEVDQDRVYLATYVKALEADVVAAAVGSATSGASNKATQTASSSSTAGSGNSGDATISSISHASYNGHADGDLSEVYTVVVIQASTDSDATTGRLQVRSASGRDDVASVTPAAFGSATAIGARGLTVTWDAGSTDYVVGDYWTVTVHQAFTAVTATSGGTYTGTKSLTYEITVTTGGAATSEITVNTTDGTDYSGPHLVSSTSAISIGTLGVTVAMSATTMRKGDKYYIVATPASTGAYKTIVLGHDLDSDIDEDDADAARLEIQLFIKKDLELGEAHLSLPGEVNWQQSDTEFCVMAGIYAYDDSYTDGGELVALPVISSSYVTNSNKMYVEYRAWRSDLAVTPLVIEDTGSIGDIAGALTPDNPLKYGVYKALQNSNGQGVRYMAVADPDDSDSWADVIDKISERTDVYGLVPLTRDSTVLGLFQAHVDAMSNEDVGRWRVLWVNTLGEDTIAIVDSTLSDDDEVVFATVGDDPDTSGTQYTLLTVTSGNAELATLGVRANDVVRYQYGTDSEGNVSYTEYVVDAVLSETTLRLAGTGLSSAEPVAKKVEIWRNLTNAELATQIATKSGAWGNRRVRAIWPDTIEDGTLSVPGYFLCAALSGLASGVVPHQGLTKLEISGFTTVDRVTKKFSRSNLDTMAVAGAWIVTQEPATGQIYSRHAVTTGDYTDINFREEQVTRNLDSISYFWLDRFSPYIGIVNNTPGMLDKLEAETRSGIDFLRAANVTPTLGGQIVDATVTEIRRSLVFKDRVVIYISYDLPYALNNIDVHQLV